MSASIDIRNNQVELAVDEKVFPRPVSVAAAYLFLNRCYIRLERGNRSQLRVFLKGKQKLAKARLTELAAEFDNELLHQLMRHQVAQQTSGLREVLVGRALLSAEPLEAFGVDQPADGSGEDLDYLDDPLGIAVPWEEKYGDDQGQRQDGQGKDDQGEGGQD
jgi:His-Xaa-Ser system protein HxsD